MQSFRYRRTVRAALAVAALAAVALAGCRERAPLADATAPAAAAETPRRGGRLVAALRAEPRTFNPVFAIDKVSSQLAHQTMADLMHINRASHDVGPGLASDWSVSEDGLRYRLALRPEVRFSDGEAFDADDVVFSFSVYLDEAVAAPSRELLLLDGEPIEVRKIDSHTVEFVLPKPYAVGTRLFDSFWILPEHRLGEAYRSGRFAEAWPVGTAPGEIVGLGPYRLRDYQPGQRLVLERNPHYWRRDDAGRELPYLDELAFLFVSNLEAQVLRFQAAESDVIEALDAASFTQIERSGGDVQARDLGPGLGYTFVVFNLNEPQQDAPAGLARRRAWFERQAFRDAVSLAIDRQALVRLVYGGHATPLASHVTPGYGYWHNESVQPPAHDPEAARQHLARAGFTWDGDGGLVDPGGTPVAFSILTSASNRKRMQIAELIREDLRRIGMEVTVAGLEFRAMIDRVLNRRDYDACILELGGGDADPNPQLPMLLSDGQLHFWRLGRSTPATPWEAEIDRLMRRQISTTDRAERKRLYDRVQELMAEHKPLINLVAEHVLVAAQGDVGNFEPGIIEPSTLWNTDRLYRRPATVAAR